ncbi:hypothetical protein [Pseudomonas protegens]|nr:hypothetical protein [Pseudomonas protegens]MCY7259794.1 hypothetical protein [Pseudomonas protegens]
MAAGLVDLLNPGDEQIHALESPLIALPTSHPWHSDKVPFFSDLAAQK